MEKELLPTAPSDLEMVRYTDPNKWLFGGVGLGCLLSAAFWLLSKHMNQNLDWGYTFFILLSLSPLMMPTLGSLALKKFDLVKHKKLIDQFEEKQKQLITVDVILPLCGEENSVVFNTMEHLKKLEEHHENGFYLVKTYVCDDTKDQEEADKNKIKAEELDFIYVRRPNLGEFKKAGNLNYALANYCQGKYLLVLDADFCPRIDFIDQTVPYMELDDNIGILQTPQFFTSNGNNLQKAAAYSSEIYYRIIQRNRDLLGITGCCGSSAVYRQKALQEVNGFAEVESSEDVNTGLMCMDIGYYIKYLPLILSMGLNPENTQSSFNQRYRWALGGISVVFTERLWGKKNIAFKKRLIFGSINSFYIFNIAGAFLFPVCINIWMFNAADSAKLSEWFSLLSIYMFSYIVIPSWNKSKAGLYFISNFTVSCFIQTIAFFDFLTRNQMEWIPTGAKVKKNLKFNKFLWLVIGWPVFNSCTLFAIVLHHNGHFTNLLPAIIQNVFVLSTVALYLIADGELILKFKKKLKLVK